MQTRFIILLKFLSYLLIVSRLEASAAVSLTLVSADQALGRVVTTITLKDSEAVKPAALEWTFRYGKAVVRHVTAVPGPQAVLADKKITCASVQKQTNCMVWGLNQKTISSGVIARVVFTFEDSSTEASVVNLYPKAAVTADGRSLSMNWKPVSDSPPWARKAMRRMRSHTKLLASLVIFAVILGAFGLRLRRV